MGAVPNGSPLIFSRCPHRDVFLRAPPPLSWVFLRFGCFLWVDQKPLSAQMGFFLCVF